MSVRPVPEGYSTVTPYLIVTGAAEAIDYYTKVFGATELMRFPGPDGKVGHAEMKIGTSIVMLADEAPDKGYRSPQSLGGRRAGEHLERPAQPLPDHEAGQRRQRRHHQRQQQQALHELLQGKSDAGCGQAGLDHALQIAGGAAQWYKRLVARQAVVARGRNRIARAQAGLGWQDRHRQP